MSTWSWLNKKLCKTVYPGCLTKYSPSLSPLSLPLYLSLSLSLSLSPSLSPSPSPPLSPGRMETLEVANAKLSSLNDFSEKRFELYAGDFHKYTQTLTNMKRELDSVFRRIR